MRRRRRHAGRAKPGTNRGAAQAASSDAEAANTAQHHRLSQILQGKPDFRGADCWGADYIVTAAAGRKTYGALETWVTIDQNTHITHTVNHLTKVVAPQLAVAG